MSVEPGGVAMTVEAEATFTFCASRRAAERG